MTVLVTGAGSVVGLSQEPHAFQTRKSYPGFSEQRSLVDIYLNC